MPRADNSGTTMTAKKTPGMKRGRVPWSEKLRENMEPAVAPDPKGRGRMLLPTPMLVAGEISVVPKGSLITFPALRARLARRLDADFTCPLMTGIFFNIVAGATEERLTRGEPALAPYWRVIREDGSLSPKTPDGPERQAERLRAEGHAIEVRGSKLRVGDAGKRLLE